jgi:hypothetical protein
MELLTAEEVAKILKCSTWFVYQNRKLFGGCKFGGLVRFEKEGFYSKLKEVFDDGVSASREMALRLHEKRTAPHGQRIRHEAGGEKRGSGGKKKSSKDKYGLLETL